MQLTSADAEINIGGEFSRTAQTITVTLFLFLSFFGRGWGVALGLILIKECRSNRRWE